MAARLAASLALLPAAALACSNLLVSPGASADGSSMLAYNSDDVSLFGSLDLRLAADHAPGDVRQMWDWDGQYYTGAIPQVPHTYNVVGNSNEWGVIITETTFGGRGDLDGHNTGAEISYGDMIWTTLERSKTAREAIATMDALCSAYGYESNGESFGVGDATEVWLLELVGKGKHVPDAKGCVWVASRIPDGYVGSTANQCRTEKFNQNDPDNVLFANDTISFARSLGYYPPDAPDADFNFREAYDPITFGGARFGEARVFNLFNSVCGGCVQQHLDFAQGYNLSNSMPLFVPAAAKLSLNDTIWAMHTHFEGSWFDNRGLSRPDVGAGQGHSPYRFRPLTWTFNNLTYLNERTVGVQQSGWAFVATSRASMPDPFKAVEWFAPDDSSTSPHVPFYAAARRIAPSFGSLVGQTPGGGVPYAPVADGFTMSLDSAFWVWNLVGNMAFSERYGDALPIILSSADALQRDLLAAQAQTDVDLRALAPVDPAAALEVASAFGERAGENVTRVWRDTWMGLFARFRDGSVILPSKDTQCVPPQVTGCVAKLQPQDIETGYDDAWRARIVAEDVDHHYLVPASAAEGASPERRALEQRKLEFVSGKPRRREAQREREAARQAKRA